MKFLLLILVLDIAGGKLAHKDTKTRVFMNEAACEEAGRILTKTLSHTSPTQKSISICIPEDAFDQ